MNKSILNDLEVSGLLYISFHNKEKNQNIKDIKDNPSHSEDFPVKVII